LVTHFRKIYSNFLSPHLVASSLVWWARPSMLAVQWLEPQLQQLVLGVQSPKPLFRWLVLVIWSLERPFRWWLSEPLLGKG